MTVYERPTAEFLATKGRVATLGMFIIDHFQVRDNDGEIVPLDEEAIGGGGIFAMTAARLFLPPSHCALLIDHGEDFPPRFTDEITSLGSDMIWFRSREGKTTRALNMYSGTSIGEGHQSFRYLSPQLHLTPKDLVLPPSPFAQPLPEWIHVVCVTERAKAIADEMTAIRSGAFGEIASSWQGKLVWEPLGRTCRPEDLDDILNVITEFAVFSPNLLEMQSILGLNPEETEPAAEDAAKRFLELVLARHPDRTAIAVVVRAGPLGSFTLSENWTGWVPPYWDSSQQHQVKDVTGGGNAWMGGFCAGMLLENDIRNASTYASTAASFAIEQRGLPRLTRKGDVEQWNGDDPWKRLNELAQRVD